MNDQPQFSRFGELPTEIRVKIWLLAARQPRNLPIKCLKDSYQSGTNKRFYVKSFKTLIPPPAVLHICQESRAEALPEYQLCFATAHSPANIYISFHRDTVVFPENVLGSLGATELSCIRSMSLEVTDYPYFAHFNMGILSGMKNLEALDIRVIQEDVSNWRRGILETLMDDFDEARERFSEDNMPIIRIVSEKTGEQLGAMQVEGGWTGALSLHREKERRLRRGQAADTDANDQTS